MAALIDLQREAADLAKRSSLDRVDYLFEVAHCAHRGPEVAEQLRCLVAEILARHDDPH